MSSVCDGKESIISKVKVFAKTDGTFIFENALTLTNSTVRFGGALIQNTDVTGSFQLNLGTTGSRLSQFNARAVSQILLDYLNGANGVSLSLSSGGAVLTDTLVNPKGLVGAANYSPNYTANTYIQKVYADSKLVGKNISGILSNPGAGQDDYVITWDNDTQTFTLSSVGAISAGSDTQVIFNSAGALTGNSEFTFGSQTLSVPNVNLGVSATIGTSRLVQAVGSQANIDLRIAPKGTGILKLEANANIHLGSNSINNSLINIQALSSSAASDIGVEAKGTDATVFIGGANHAGGYRRLAAKSSATNAYLLLQGQGTGGVAVGTSNNSDLELGTTLWTGTVRTIFAKSSASNVDLAIAPQGINRKVLIGSSNIAHTAPIIEPQSSNANCDLVLQGKGTGVVIINGIGYKLLQIGDWNMDSAPFTTVTHGVTNWKTIKVLGVTVRDDTDNFYYPLDYFNSGSNDVDGGPGGISSTTISLFRKASGVFDSPNFDSTGYNRGEVLISFTI
jgi:hypothetical protein